MERVEVKTKAAAEKAIKAGKPISITAGKFALALACMTDVNIHIAAQAAIELTLTDVRGTVSQEDMWTSRVEAWGSSSVVARGSSRVEAWESSRVVAWESSSVVARGSSRVVARGSSSVEAWGSSSVVARESSRVVARGSSSVEAWGSSSVVAWGSSRVEARGSSSVEAWGSSSVVAWGSSRVEAWGSSSVVAWGSSRVEAWGSSSVVARGSSRVVARGSSRVVAWESSSVEAWESSSVEAWGSSSVVAWGYSMLQARSPSARLKAAPTVAVNLWDGSTCDGGRQQVVSMSTAEDWCNYYGVRIEGEFAVVYKGVGKGYMSGHGGIYTPGTMPEDKAWNGRRGECERGCGLNFSPTPRHTHEFHRNPDHYLEARIRLDEMNVHFGGSYPQKCTAQRVAAPLIEVDVDGNPVTAPEPVE